MGDEEGAKRTGQSSWPFLSTVLAIGLTRPRFLPAARRGEGPEGVEKRPRHWASSVRFSPLLCPPLQVAGASCNPSGWITSALPLVLTRSAPR